MDFYSSYLEAVDLLKNIIAIPSPSREEEKVCDFLEDFMRKKDLPVIRIKNNLYCKGKYYKENKPTILLNAHIDTIKRAGEWTKEPFSATEEEGRIYGLGSNDDGGSLVCLFETFLLLQNTSQSYNLIFSATSEEEVCGKNGIESIFEAIGPCALAIVGEPTGMHLAVGEKGLMVLDCTAHGKSGHAARNEGVNAIYEAMKDIEWFRTYQFPKVSEALGCVKMTVTLIQAGTQHNVVPDQCTFVVDIRSNDCYKNEELFALIQEQVKCEVHARSFRLNSSHISLSHPFVQRGIALGRNTFGSPTMSNQSLIPFTSVKIGPGESSRSHGADEYIRLQEIEESIPLFYQLLDGLQI